LPRVFTSKRAVKLLMVDVGSCHIYFKPFGFY
jgi:hypothetical protein